MYILIYKAAYYQINVDILAGFLAGNNPVFAYFWIGVVSTNAVISAFLILAQKLNYSYSIVEGGLLVTS